MSALITAGSIVGKLNYRCKYPSCRNGYYSNISQIDFKNKKFHRFPRNSETIVMEGNL